ncbi:MAG TPA: hypothetical protein VJQ47_05895 [Steroidobacteraceae bacterium]|nr:hypothetical protein [Steroidobacteraceae bacterium]
MSRPLDPLPGRGHGLSGPYDRGWIQAHIPHQGRMCLLDSVVSWDDCRARCRATTHRALDNPLRARGQLGAACAIEYAAQSMAVHGALLASAAGTTVLAGLVASVRGVMITVLRLDDLEGDLLADVERVASDEHSALYVFGISHDGSTLVSGRATIAFRVPA